MILFRVVAIASLFTLSGVASASDIMVVTSSAEVVEALRAEVAFDSPHEEEAATWSLARFDTDRFNKPYQIVLVKLPGLNLDAATDRFIERFKPRYVVLLETAPAIGDKLMPGDVAVGRLIWDFDATGSTIESLLDRQFRADGALVNASLAVSSDWHATLDVDRPPKIAAGAIAGGRSNASHGKPFYDAIKQANDRTIAVVTDSAHISERLESAQAKGHSVGLIPIAGIDASDDASGSKQQSRAGGNAVAFAITLWRETWPVAPR